MERLYFINIWVASVYAAKNNIQNYHFEPAELTSGIYLVKD